VYLEQQSSYYLNLLEGLTNKRRRFSYEKGCQERPERRPSVNWPGGMRLKKNAHDGPIIGLGKR
jgi:hypothetical protein